MTFQVFNTSGSWSWPADVTHVHVQIWGGGGGGAGSTTTQAGGGGEGGDKRTVIVYNRGGGLTVTIGPGGAGGGPSSVGNDGGDSKITQLGTDEIVAYGGAHGFFGGRAETIGTGMSGGAGGKGLFNSGGGGGAGGPGGAPASYDPVDGQDAASPTPDLFHEDDAGFGGTPSPGGGGGRGGNGGGLADGNDGSLPGGAGGGAGPDISLGGSGHSGGDGAHGRAILKWSTVDGLTLASSGCCCGVCDLTKGQFPQSVRPVFALTPTTPSWWDADHQSFDSGSVDWLGNGCDPGGTFNTSWGGYSQDNNRPSSAMTGIVNGFSPNLEMVTFSAGGNTTYSYCHASYECPLADPSIDDGKASTGFMDIDSRWCPVGAPPPSDYSSPSDHLFTDGFCGPDFVNHCITSTAYWWKKIGTMRATMGADLTIKRYHDATWGYAVDVLLPLMYYPAQSDVDVSSDSCSPDPNPPNLNAWGLASATSWNTSFASFSADGFGSGEEALAAARTALGGAITLTSEWRDKGFPSSFFRGYLNPGAGSVLGMWIEHSEGECCPDHAALTSVSESFIPDWNNIDYSEGTAGITW